MESVQHVSGGTRKPRNVENFQSNVLWNSRSHLTMTSPIRILLFANIILSWSQTYATPFSTNARTELRPIPALYALINPGVSKFKRNASVGVLQRQKRSSGVKTAKCVGKYCSLGQFEPFCNTFGCPRSAAAAIKSQCPEGFRWDSNTEKCRQLVSE